MRFRCEMCGDGVKTVSSVVRSLERVESIRQSQRQQLRCVIWLSPDEVNIGLVIGQVQASILAFAGLRARGGAFSSYLIESAAGNNIYLSLLISHLSRGLSSAESGGNLCTLKLGKRSATAQLLLQFEASQGSKVEHAIPVKLLRKHEIEAYSAPQLPEPRIALELPAVDTLRTLVERLKAVGDRDAGRGKRVDLKLEANGTLALRLVADAAVVKAFFSHLRRIGSTQYDNEDHVLVSVDSKKLAHALHAYTLDFDLIECCPIEGRILLLNVKLSNGVGDLLYYVPLLDEDDDDDYEPDDLDQHQQDSPAYQRDAFSADHQETHAEDKSISRKRPRHNLEYDDKSNDGESNHDAEAPSERISPLHFFNTNNQASASY